MVAGEASGDLLASLLLSGLHQRWPGLRAVGIGGPRMAEQGFEAWWPYDKLAVHGYAEALAHYREISGIRKALAQRLPQLEQHVVGRVDDGVDRPHPTALETALEPVRRLGDGDAAHHPQEVGQRQGLRGEFTRARST